MENNRIKGLSLSILFHIVLGLLCFFVTLSVPFSEEETEAGGIVINYGVDEVGAGVDAYNVEEVSKGEEQKLQSVFEKPNYSSSNTSNAGKAYTTQDNEDAPELNATTSGSNKVDPNQKGSETTPINEAAIYKGPKSKGTSQGDGDGNVIGNQGVKNGDVNSGNYTSGENNGIGGGGGGNGVALNLQGRKFLVKPNIKDDTQQRGQVVVEIKVDQTGTIIEANAGYRGTTISDAFLWQKCERAVLGAKLNALASAPELQIGTVIFNFDLQ